MNNTRVEEIVRGMNSFNRGAYYKSEMLNEMFNLQNEIVSLTFNEEQGSLSNLKIYDVEHNFEKLNQELGNVADVELRNFKKGAITLSRLISAEISGNRGEQKAFSTLRNLRTVNRVLTNVELSNRYYRTELDAVVITPSGLTILEVKNTSRNIYIDENGDYYLNGDYMNKDCNIAQKNDIKEKMLREVLMNNGITNVDIRTVVVFTNDHIEVHNRCPQVNTTFVNMLCHTVEQFRSNKRLALENIKNLESIVDGARCREAYPADFDVKQFKEDFAILKVKIEEAVSLKSKVANASNDNKTSIFNGLGIRKWLRTGFYRVATGVASVLLSMAASATVMSSNN